jgi:hypothetical protein
MSVVIKPQGRLGNQLFQWTTARLLADKYGLQIKSPWGCADLLKAVEPPLGQAYQSPVIHLPNSPHLWSQDYSKPARYVIDQYMQFSELFWRDRERIKAMYCLPCVEPLPNNVIGAHVRMTDYETAWGKSRVVDPTWYTGILNRLDWSELHLYSDEPDIRHPWVPQFMLRLDTSKRGGVHFHFGGDSMESFHAMRRFRRFLIGNSTFSWWATFLGCATQMYMMQRWVEDKTWIDLWSMPGAVTVDGVFYGEDETLVPCDPVWHAWQPDASTIESEAGMVPTLSKHAVYINLDHRTDRNEGFLRHAKEHGIVAERFSAIRPTSADGHVTVGVAGCKASHLAVVKLAKERNWPYVIIFEDDAIPQKDFHVNFDQAMRELVTQRGPNWDMFYLYIGSTTNMQAAHRVSEHVWKIHGTQASHAYVVNARGYDRFIDYVGNPADKRDCDLMLLNRSGMDIFGVTPRLAENPAGVGRYDSDIRPAGFKQTITCRQALASGEMPVTFVVPCMGRAEALKQTLPSLLGQFPVVLVDYSCPDHCGDWAMQDFNTELQDHILQIVRVQGEVKFNVSRARNAGAAVVTTPYVGFIDADMLVNPQFGVDLIKKIRAGAYAIRFNTVYKAGHDGFIVVKKSLFDDCGGYWEGLENWGGDDILLKRKIQAIGVIPQCIQPHSAVHLKHDDDDRVKYYDVKSKEESCRANRIIIQQHLDEWIKQRPKKA